MSVINHKNSDIVSFYDLFRVLVKRFFLHGLIEIEFHHELSVKKIQIFPKSFQPSISSTFVSQGMRQFL